MLFCPPIGGGTYQPQGSLASLIGENPNGTWTLTIVDNFNQDGGSLNTWGLDICVNSPLGILSLDKLNKVLLYPNPVNNVLTVDLSQTTPIKQLILTDVSGRIVYQLDNITNSKLQINLANFSNGLYLLKLKTTTMSKTFKVIKN